MDKPEDIEDLIKKDRDTDIEAIHSGLIDLAIINKDLESTVKLIVTHIFDSNSTLNKRGGENMQISRDGKIYTLTEDELFAAYQEQLSEFFYEDAEILIKQRITPDSLKQVSVTSLEIFIKEMASAGYKKYLKVDCSRYEAIKLALDEYLSEHHYRFPFECVANLETDLF